MSFILEPPPGFQGLRRDLPVTMYRRDLPHWRQDGATYFVTFRLHDSLPKHALDELQAIRDAWEEKQADPDAEVLWRHVTDREEYWLDQGHGSCILADPLHQKHPIKILLANQHDMTDLSAYAIMPNHVHLVTRPLHPVDRPLEEILRRWKGASAREINRSRGGSGTFWFPESYDQIVRDAEHLYRCVQYIGGNPGKANLANGHFDAWVSPAWQALGWGFKV